MDTLKDPFLNQNNEFDRLVLAAKGSKDFRIAYLIEASRIKNNMGTKNLETSDYDKLVDEEVYSHVTRRLREIIETIRGDIHKKENDKAALFLTDMRMLGDFVKSKKIKFDFEFYDKINKFFNEKKRKEVKEMPKY
jgi:hypothetical protein